MIMNLTDKFISYLDGLRNSDFPAVVIKKARECLIDYIGVTYAGAYVNNDVFKSMISVSGGECSILGNDNQKTDPSTAAFINGYNAHTIELDDGHRFGMIHLGSVIISAVLAVAQQEDLTLDDVLRGIIIGYEAAVRTAVSMQPGHKKAGFHTTGTCGTIGAAAGCAAAAGYTSTQLKSVLSAASTSAAGLLEIQENSSQLKAFNVANAARNGVTAFYIGKTGLSGPDDIMGGDRGMLAIHSSTVNAEKLTEHQSYYEIERIYVKPYAACRHCHSAIESAIFLRNKYNIPPENIKEIIVETYSLAIRGHSHTEIKGMTSAKLSMPYSVAAAYILGSGGLEAFEKDKITDSHILELTGKVKVIENEEFTALSPGKRTSKIRIYADDGSMVGNQVDYAKGDPENPLTEKELEEKYISEMQWCSADKNACELISFIRKDNINIRDLFNI